jgi:2-iminobutanoate/2-iminopropanoate deaminase
MVEKEIFGSAGLGEPIGPFARAVRAGSLIAVSGTSALSHLSGPLHERSLDSDFDSQARLTFANLRRALRDSGVDWADVVKLTVMLKRREDYAALNRLRAEVLAGARTASTTFVCELIRDDMLIEVDAWAAVVTR